MQLWQLLSCSVLESVWDIKHAAIKMGGGETLTHPRSTFVARKSSIRRAKLTNNFGVTCVRYGYLLLVKLLTSIIEIIYSSINSALYNSTYRANLSRCIKFFGLFFSSPTLNFDLGIYISYRVSSNASCAIKMTSRHETIYCMCSRAKLLAFHDIGLYLFLNQKI